MGGVPEIVKPIPTIMNQVPLCMPIPMQPQVQHQHPLHPTSQPPQPQRKVTVDYLSMNRIVNFIRRELPEYQVDPNNIQAMIYQLLRDTVAQQQGIAQNSL